MLPQCSLARLLCQMKLMGGWAGQQILLHLLLKLKHLQSHSVDQKFVLSDSNHVELMLLPGFFGCWNKTPLIIPVIILLWTRTIVSLPKGQLW
jgi:hypothetical protein